MYKPVLTKNRFYNSTFIDLLEELKKKRYDCCNKPTEELGDGMFKVYTRYLFGSD